MSDVAQSGEEQDCKRPVEECVCLFDLIAPSSYRQAHEELEDEEPDGTRGEHVRAVGKTLDGRDVLVRLSNFRPWLYLDLEDWVGDPLLPAILCSILQTVVWRLRASFGLPSALRTGNGGTWAQKEAAKSKRAREVGERVQRLRERIEEVLALGDDHFDKETMEDGEGGNLIGIKFERRKQMIGWEPDPQSGTKAGEVKTRKRLYAILTFRNREHLRTADRVFSRALTIKDPANEWEHLLASPHKFLAYEGGHSVAMETKFFTKTDQAPFSWFWLKEKEEVTLDYERDSDCALEYRARMEDIVAQPQHKGLFPPFRLAAVDTEWMSYNTVDFPQYENWGDFQICIGMVWADVVPGKPFKVNYECDAYADPKDPRYALPGDSLPNPVHPAQRADGSAPANALIEAAAALKNLLQETKRKPDVTKEEVAGVREEMFYARAEAFYRRHPTELGVFRSWFRRIKALKIDALFTFNGDKFDLKYMYNRLMALAACSPEDLDFLRCTRLRKHVCRLTEKEFNTKGKGYNAYQRIFMPGVLSYDMLLWAKDNFPKLTRHNLDSVLAEMKLRLKNDIHPQQIFKYTREGGHRWLEVLFYCEIDCKRTIQVVHKGNFLPRWLALASVTRTPWSILAGGGQQVRVWNLLLHEAHKGGFVVNQVPARKPNGLFKWTDDDRLTCKLTVQRRPRESIRTWFAPVPIDWSGKWPGRKDISTKFKVRLEDKLKVSEKLVRMGFVMIYTGATVIKPKTGHHKFPIVTLDYQSLYPSIIIAYNLCYASVVNGATPEFLERYKDVIQLFEVTKGKPHIFVKACVEEGLLPKMLAGVLAARRAIKKLMEVETDESRKTCQEAEQLELKVTANSGYGFTGAIAGKLPDPRIAETVTFNGRNGLEVTKQLIEALDLPALLTSQAWATFVNQSKWLSTVTWYSNCKPAVVDEAVFKKLHERPFADKERANAAKIQKAIDSVPVALWSEQAEGHLNAAMKYMNERPELVWVIDRYGPVTENPITLLVPGYRTEVIYGDSVTADCPVVWRNALTKYIRISNIEDLPHFADQETPEWVDYHGDKQAIAYSGNVQVWTEKGWTGLRRIVRHQTDKRIVQVLTHTACVKVTEDHSLLDQHANKVTPNDVKVGDDLLHADLPMPDDSANKNEPSCGSVRSPDHAYALGLFYAQGFCGQYDGASWTISNLDASVLDRALVGLDQGEHPLTFKILNTLAFKVVPSSDGQEKEQDNLVERYREMFYDRHANKQVPSVVLNAPRCLRQAFWDGYCAGRKDQGEGTVRCDNKGQIGAAGLYWLAASLGYPVSINTGTNEPTVCTNAKRQVKNPNAIKKIEVLGRTQEYVYDLETENHHFSAGVGRMIVHNTDSVMVRFPLLNNCNGRRAAFMLGYYGAARATAIMPKPMSLMMEKIYDPYVLFGKKCYLGLKWMVPDDLAPSKDVKGLNVVRRDCIALFRDQIQLWINEILDSTSFERAFAHFEEFKKVLLEKRFQYHTLKQSKSVKPHYANDKQVQVVVCRQMEEDAPGSAPTPGARVEYVVGSTGKKDDKMFNRVLAWSRAERYLQEGRMPPGFTSIVDIGYYLEHNLLNTFVNVFGVWMRGGQVAAKRYFEGFAAEAAMALSGQNSLQSFFDKQRALVPSTASSSSGSSSSASSLSSRPSMRSLFAPVPADLQAMFDNAPKGKRRQAPRGNITTATATAKASAGLASVSSNPLLKRRKLNNSAATDQPSVANYFQ